MLTTGLTIGTGLNKKNVEGRRQVPGCLVLLVCLVERHEEVLLDRQGGLEEQQGQHSGLGTAFRARDSIDSHSTPPLHPKASGRLEAATQLCSVKCKDGHSKPTAQHAGKLLGLKITQFLLLFSPPKVITRGWSCTLLSGERPI